MMHRKLNIALALFMLLMSAGLAGATDLPTPLREVKPELRSIGTARLRVFGLHVYDIALHADEAPFTTNSAAVLVIRYNISIKRGSLLETTLEEWQRMGKGGAAEHKQWIKQLESLWPDVKSGDSLTAFRLRNGPTQFYLGDRLLGEVSDPAFGPAFFAIWLDPACRYPKVRSGLLKEKDTK